jgi:uncharacterized repeat protein (TIGR02543 family)
MKHKTKKLFLLLSLVMSMLLLMGLANALAKNEDPKILETSYTADTPGPFTIVGISPNEKTEAKWVWTHNEKLYIAIIADIKKPLEQVSYGGTTYNSSNTELWQWWIADSFNSPLTINGDPKYIDSNKKEGSRWIVIELANAPLTGRFLLGLDCGPDGFSAWGNEALPVQIDSKLTITKIVQDASGNTINTPETFTITVSGPEGDKPFEITNGIPLVLTGLLYGEYSVTEQDADNYNVLISNPVTLSMGNNTGSILITNKVKTYTVSYNANGGEGTLTDTESPYIYNETVTVLANGFTRTGYNFTGWNIATDGSGIAYVAGDTFSMPAADLTLFAQWKKSSSGGAGGGGGSSTVVVDPVPPGDDDSSQTVIVEPIPPTLNKEEHFAYIVGYPENIVRPERYITREEVAAVFYRLLDEDYRATIKTTINDFSDVGMDRWSSKYIATLVKGGIIVGYPDKSFRPQNSITRAEVATIASKFDKLSITDTNKFSDVFGHWAQGYINSAVEKGWVNGYPDNTFKPNQYITRAEFVTLVNNVLERRVHKEDILPEAKQFPDLEIESWYYEAMQEAINSHYYNRKADTYEEWLQIYYPNLEM